VPFVRGDEIFGLVQIGSRSAARLSPVDQQLVMRLVAHANAVIIQHVARERLERNVTELRFLGEAAKLLGSSLNFHETLEKLAALAVPAVADWCVVDIVEHGELNRLTIAHTDSSRYEEACEWARRYPPSIADEGGTAGVVRSGEPAVLFDVTGHAIDRFTSSPAERDALRALGVTSLVCAPLTARGNVLGAITLLMSTSKRHYGASDVLVAAELGRYAGIAIDNARMFREAQEALRTREQILSVVSHDLRNPLSVIDLGASSALEDPTLDPRTRKQIEMILRSAERMQRLIEDLLDLGRIQGGSLKLDRKPHVAADILRDAFDAHDAIARDKGIRLVQHNQLEGVLVDCDRERINQVLANLVGNAIKFCRSGDTITIEGRADDGHVRYVVADTGPGIPASDLPHIFDPYWSADDHAKLGLGLGLYICKAIVDLHGGEMRAESEQGSGATFTVTLRMARRG
jgi:signal transduction histidine kinase